MKPWRKSLIRNSVKRIALLLPLLLIGSCGEPESGPSMAGPEIYRSERNGLCVAGSGESLRAGFIAFGPGDANCSAAGSAERANGVLRITPRGERACLIEITLENGQAVFAARSDACAYYCGPGADFSGLTLQHSSDSRAVTDLAGDPLC